MTPGFELMCEVEPAVRPDLVGVRHQIGVMSRVAHRFLIPDNHIGRATVSSIAVAHEVAQMGGRAVACLNARDRNTLGFRRDLLTAAAYGVDEFLFVRGGEQVAPEAEQVPIAGVQAGDPAGAHRLDLVRDRDTRHGGPADVVVRDQERVRDRAQHPDLVPHLLQIRPRRRLHLTHQLESLTHTRRP